MRHVLGVLALLLLVPGCGTETEPPDAAPRASEQASAESASPSGSPAAPVSEGPLEFTQVALVSRTAVGGEVDRAATVLDDSAATTRFGEQFETGGMGEEVAAAVARTDVPEGQVLLGAVVALGCDVPSEVAVARTSEGVTITALKTAKPLKECLAAVTTVALVLVDENAV